MAQVYACPGSCHGIATLEQWEHGAKTCKAKTCERRSQPLQPMEQCPDCAIKFADGKIQTCPRCRPLMP